jgi:hypothetical protein
VNDPSATTGTSGAPAPATTPAANAVRRAESQLVIAAVAPDAKAIGWEILIGPILEAAISAISGCLRSRDQLAAGLANPGILEQAALRRAVRSELQARGQRATPAQVNAGVEAALKVARDATPEQRRDFLDAVAAYAPDHSPI